MKELTKDKYERRSPRMKKGREGGKEGTRKGRMQRIRKGRQELGKRSVAEEQKIRTGHCIKRRNFYL